MAWASHGWLQGALLASAALLLAPRVAAEAGARGAPERSNPAESPAESGSWLRWQGPIECQNTLEVERQLESLLGYAPDKAQLPSTRVEVGWGSARGWSLLIRVSLPQGERRREVVVRTCADGFDVVALTLALILDPELGGDTELDEEPAAGADALDPGATGPTLESLAAAAPAEPSPALEPGPIDPISESEPPPATQAASRPALRVAAGARADLGSLPAALLGGGLSLVLSGWHWRLDAGAAYLARGAQSLPQAVNEVSYENVLGLLRGCREFTPRGGGHFGVCLGGQLGSLAVSEDGGQRHNGRGLWAAGTAGIELGLELSEAWSAYSGLELVFPLARHQLGLATGAVVYELPAISVQLTVGGVVRLTEWAVP